MYESLIWEQEGCGCLCGPVAESWPGHARRGQARPEQSCRLAPHGTWPDGGGGGGGGTSSLVTPEITHMCRHHVHCRLGQVSTYRTKTYFLLGKSVPTRTNTLGQVSAYRTNTYFPWIKLVPTELTPTSLGASQYRQN